MRFAWSVRAQRVRSFLYRWAAEDRGSVATEYGLLLMLIALAIVVGATALGIAVSHMFDQGRSLRPRRRNEHSGASHWPSLFVSYFDCFISFSAAVRSPALFGDG